MVKEKVDLDALIVSFDQKYGKGTVQTGEKSQVEGIEKWPVDAPRISDIIGGGIPKGRIIELYGPESAGKTTIATYFAVQIQKAGGRVAIIDAENAYDLKYAETHGLDINKVLFTQPDSGEDSLNIVEEMSDSGLVNYIIVDSVAALTPQAEIEGEMGDQQMGLQARLMSKACRKLKASINKNNTTVLFLNQIRMKIGVMFGNPEVTPGGKALKFYSSIRLEVRRKENIIGTGGPEDIIGIKSNLKCVKNKVARPFKKGEIDIYFDTGIDSIGQYLDYSISQLITKKSGAWYSYKEEKIGQGRTKTIKFLKESPELFNEIKVQVDSLLNPKLVKEIEPPKKRDPKPKKEEPAINTNIKKEKKETKK